MFCFTIQKGSLIIVVKLSEKETMSSNTTRIPAGSSRSPVGCKEMICLEFEYCQVYVAINNSAVLTVNYPHCKFN